MTRRIEDNPEDMPPLSPIMLQLLIVLSERGELHGYSLKKFVEKRTDGRIKLGPSTLYGTLLRMSDAGLIEETEERLDEYNEKRRFFKITEFGLRVFHAESNRLQEMAQLVFATESLGEKL